MALKRYITRHGNLNIPVKVGQQTVRIRFIASDHINGIYATSREDIQQALEKDSLYETLFHSETPASDAETLPPPTEVTEVTSWQQARELLRKPPYSIPAKALQSAKSIEREAQRLNVSFPNIQTS